MVSIESLKGEIDDIKQMLQQLLKGGGSVSPPAKVAPISPGTLVSSTTGGFDPTVSIHQSLVRTITNPEGGLEELPRIYWIPSSEVDGKLIASMPKESRLSIASFEKQVSGESIRTAAQSA